MLLVRYLGVRATNSIYYTHLWQLVQLPNLITITVPSQKRAHYGMSAHPSLWAQFSAIKGPMFTRICAHVQLPLKTQLKWLVYED